MSVIDCNYLPVDKVVFPPELAQLIVRKASAMAAAFETSSLRIPGEHSPKVRISEHRDRPFRLIVTGHFANA